MNNKVTCLADEMLLDILRRYVGKGVAVAIAEDTPGPKTIYGILEVVCEERNTFKVSMSISRGGVDIEYTAYLHVDSVSKVILIVHPDGVPIFVMHGNKIY